VWLIKKFHCFDSGGGRRPESLFCPGHTGVDGVQCSCQQYPRLPMASRSQSTGTRHPQQMLPRLQPDPLTHSSTHPLSRLQPDPKPGPLPFKLHTHLPGYNPPPPKTSDPNIASIMHMVWADGWPVGAMQPKPTTGGLCLGVFTSLAASYVLALELHRLCEP
jgi:hypothetical protein